MRTGLLVEALAARASDGMRPLTDRDPDSLRPLAGKAAWPFQGPSHTSCPELSLSSAGLTEHALQVEQTLLPRKLNKAAMHTLGWRDYLVVVK